MSEWIRFTLSGRSIKPKVAIRKGGQIGLNNSVVNENELNKYKYVVLFIKKDEKLIGIRFTNDDKEEGVRKIRFSKYGATIPAKKFIEMYKLETIKKRQLDCSWDKKETMVIAKYSE